MSTPTGRRRSTTKGFTRTSSLLRGKIRDASASRGFAQAQVLTHWEEIAGPQTAKVARPVQVTYSKGGFGATLVLLTTGANAPMLEMEKEKIRDRVNAVYGYNAIARVRITQTAPTGFAEGQVMFGAAPKSPERSEPNAQARAAAAQNVAPVQNAELRAALERLGAQIMSKSNN